ncbi:MAG TPA: PE-PPE domain-containing protein, partial [Mycobacterium sp.]|nr:PE-PPE domain-containing protein [Mycobacterium sp.]
MGKAGMKHVQKVAMGVAAVGVATSIAGVAATQPASISTPLVDLAALIVVGSSTHPDGSGTEDFFGGKFNATPYNTTGDDIVHVNFFSGPAGIYEALQANAGEPNAVLTSGWGAANASWLLREMAARNDPLLNQTLFVLDNDVAMPDGGFGTRYPWFALIGVNPFPTPSVNSAAGVVEIAYEYDYNSNAPADVWNVLAAVNSLVGYLYRHLNQAELNLPVDVNGQPNVTCGGANTCGITENDVVLACPDAQCGPVPPGDRVAAYVTKRDNTTYVTYTSNGLPLANLIRDVVPFGDLIADLTEPLLKALVDSAYYNGNPIPADPSQYRPARLFPPPNELVATAAKIPGAIQEGITNVTSPEPSTTSTTTTTVIAEAAPDEEESKPLTNVVRDSDKAVPGSLEMGSTTAADPE